MNIGHGEDVEKERKIKKEDDMIAETANAAMVEVDKELEEYSNAEDSELSFIDHTKAILRKKVLVQIRDKKTLGIDTVFPVVLIIVGLALATIKTFQNGGARTMSSALYPQPNNVYVNGNSYNTAKEGATLTSDDINSFMTNYMFKDSNETKYTLNSAY